MTELNVRAWSLIQQCQVSPIPHPNPDLAHAVTLTYDEGDDLWYWKYGDSKQMDSCPTAEAVVITWLVRCLMSEREICLGVMPPCYNEDGYIFVEGYTNDGTHCIGRGDTLLEALVQAAETTFTFVERPEHSGEDEE